jgi:glycosyltransferase involved in cell wall biosynthesis
VSDTTRLTALYVTAEPAWPSNSGGRARAAAQITALRSWFQVLPLSATSPDSGEREWDDAVKRVLERRASVVRRALDIGAGVLFGDHTIHRRASSAGLPEAFRAVVERLRPGVVVLARPFFGQFIAAARDAGARVVIDADERMAPLLRGVARDGRMPAGRRIRALVELTSLGRMERREYVRADRVWVATEIEQRGLSRQIAGVDVDVVPNVAPVDVRTPPCGDGVRAVAYVGSYGHAPNEAAALELMTTVMPAVRAAGGPRRLVLIGRDPTGPMRRAAANDPEVEIAGTVDDVAPWLCGAGVLVVPIRSAGGSRVKILEAAALGVPVVSTARGIEGLPFRTKTDFLPAETSSEFAQAVRRLASDEALRAAIVASAQRRVTEVASPHAVAKAIAESLDLSGSSARTLDEPGRPQE